MSAVLQTGIIVRIGQREEVALFELGVRQAIVSLAQTTTRVPPLLLVAARFWYTHPHQILNKERQRVRPVSRLTGSVRRQKRGRADVQHFQEIALITVKQTRAVKRTHTHFIRSHRGGSKKR